jgi:hypothetical protein
VVRRRTINVFESRHGTSPGGHHRNILQEIDVISFGYNEGDERPTAAQARAAIARHLKYRRDEE